MTFTIGRGNELCGAAIEAFRSHVVGRDLDDLEADLGSHRHRPHLRQPDALARPREGRRPPRHRRARQRPVGPAGPPGRQAAVEVPRRPHARAGRRRPSTSATSPTCSPRRAALDAARRRRRGTKAEREAAPAGRRLPRLHHLGRLARLRRRQGPRRSAEPRWPTAGRRSR